MFITYAYICICIWKWSLLLWPLFVWFWCRIYGWFFSFLFFFFFAVDAAESCKNCINATSVHRTLIASRIYTWSIEMWFDDLVIHLTRIDMRGIVCTWILEPSIYSAIVSNIAYMNSLRILLLFNNVCTYLTHSLSISLAFVHFETICCWGDSLLYCKTFTIYKRFLNHLLHLFFLNR